MANSRVVTAPAPLLGTAALPPNRVTSVLLNPHEEVRWVWTHAPGGSYISGYTIVESRPRKPKRNKARKSEPTRRDGPSR